MKIPYFSTTTALKFPVRCFRKRGRRSPSTHPFLWIRSHDIYIRSVVLASPAANLHVLRQNTICIAGVLSNRRSKMKGKYSQRKKGKEKGEEIEETIRGLEVATVPQARAVILELKSVAGEIGTHVYVVGVERRFK